MALAITQDRSGLGFRKLNFGMKDFSIGMFSKAIRQLNLQGPRLVLTFISRLIYLFVKLNNRYDNAVAEDPERNSCENKNNK